MDDLRYRRRFSSSMIAMSTQKHPTISKDLLFFHPPPVDHGRMVSADVNCLQSCPTFMSHSFFFKFFRLWNHQQLSRLQKPECLMNPFTVPSKTELHHNCHSCHFRGRHYQGTLGGRKYMLKIILQRRSLLYLIETRLYKYLGKSFHSYLALSSEISHCDRAIRQTIGGEMQRLLGKDVQSVICR